MSSFHFVVSCGFFFFFLLHLLVSFFFFRDFFLTFRSGLPTLFSVFRLFPLSCFSCSGLFEGFFLSFWPGVQMFFVFL